MKFNKNILTLSLALLSMTAFMQARYSDMDNYATERMDERMDKKSSKKMKNKDMDENKKKSGGTPRRQRVYNRRHPQSRNQ